jgi:hypothetical protein
MAAAATILGLGLSGFAIAKLPDRGDDERRPRFLTDDHNGGDRAGHDAGDDHGGDD